MEQHVFWLSLLIVAILGTWLWNQATAAVSGPLAPLLNFAAGFAVAGAAVLLARWIARINGGRKGGKQ